MATTAQSENIKLTDKGQQLSQNRPDSQASLEDILGKKGVLTSEQATFVKNEAKRRQETTEKIIEHMGWANDAQIAQAKADIIGVPYVAPDQQPISPEVLAFLPEEVAKRFIVIPIAKEGETLSVAMVDPLDLQVLEFIEKKSGFSVRPYIATADSITRAIAEQYTRGLSFEVGEALKEASPSIASAFIPESSVSGVIGEAPFARIVSTLLEYGIKVKL